MTNQQLQWVRNWRASNPNQYPQGALDEDVFRDLHKKNLVEKEFVDS